MKGKSKRASFGVWPLKVFTIESCRDFTLDIWLNGKPRKDCFWAATLMGRIVLLSEAIRLSDGSLEVDVEREQIASRLRFGIGKIRAEPQGE